MRITFVIPHAGLARGVRVVANFSDWLTRHGHEVVVVSRPRQTLGFGRKLKSCLRGRGWPDEPARLASYFDHSISIIV